MFNAQRVAQLVHHGGEQIHMTKCFAGVGCQQFPIAGLHAELHIVGWAGVHKPAVASSVSVYQNRRASRLTESQTGKIGYLEAYFI